MTNIRLDLTDTLRDALPKKWRVIPYADIPQNPRNPVLMVSQTGVTKNAGAPRLYRDNAFTLNLLEPGLNPETVEDLLDADVEILLDVLDDLDYPAIWSNAERVMFESKFHGYRISLTVTTEKDND